MSALLSLGIVLHLMGISVANVLAPVITPPARHRRQEDFEDDPAFFGYYHTTNINGTREGTPTPAFCGNGATFTTSSSVDRNFITCCPDGADCGDYFVTECSLTTIAYFSDTSMECTPSCNSDLVFTYSSVDALPMNYIGCNSFGGDVYYRQNPGAVLAATTSTSSSTSIPTLPSSSTSTLPTETTTSIPSLPTIIAASENKENKASKAWVAGVVVGAVALIAIAGMAFWLLRLRKRHTQQAYQQAPQVAQAYIQQPYVESYASPPNAVSSMLSTQLNAKGALTPSSELPQARGSFQHDPQSNSWYKPATTPPAQPTVPIDGSTTVQTSPPREMNSFISPVTNELPELVDGSHIRK